MVVFMFYFFSLTRSVIALTKKFRDFDWLKTSAFFMQNECKLQIARALPKYFALTFCDAFFM